MIEQIIKNPFYSKYQKLSKGILLGVASFVAIVGLVTNPFILSYFLAVEPAFASVHGSGGDFQATADNGATVSVSPSGSDNLDGNGNYTVTYTFTALPNLEGGHRDYSSVSFPVMGEIHTCQEGNGNVNGHCVDPSVIVSNPTITLNQANSFTQSITLEKTQSQSLPCGSFQSDITKDGTFLITSFIATNKDVSSCVVTPSPSPSPSIAPSPSPSPSASASTVSCPNGTTMTVVGSTIVCVAQSQNQDQNQNQSQGNNSSSSSSSSNNNVEINNTVSTPTVVTQVSVPVKELPKTGLPLAGLALAGMLPVGAKLRKIGFKSQAEDSANSIWNQKQLKVS